MHIGIDNVFLNEIISENNVETSVLETLDLQWLFSHKIKDIETWAN